MPGDLKAQCGQDSPAGTPSRLFTSTSNRRCGKRDEGMVENVVGDEEDI